ncbi:MAG: TrbI/VirB10 family protein [Acidobacteriaceae bacterium]|nr:TrbI/VirB10 family protein [Acidobacteriaceae bacterium]
MADETKVPVVQDNSATEQPQPEPPLKKGKIIFILIALIAIIGLVNLIGLGKKQQGPKATSSGLVVAPSVSNPQTVQNFTAQQQMQAIQDAQKKQQQIDLQMIQQQIQAQQDEQTPGPESDAAAPMTAAQRREIYGDGNPNAPHRTSNTSQAHAEAQQAALAREKQHRDALASSTIAVDFAHNDAAAAAKSEGGNNANNSTAQLVTALNQLNQSNQPPAAKPSEQPEKEQASANPMQKFEFDTYDGKLYRVFEGTVFEGVVTNHIEGGFNGPIIVMLTTDYYSHNHQQLLLPQGTRLIGTVQSVTGQNQDKLFVTFHRAVCPDGFSLEFNKYIGLDTIGTTGLATKVNRHYLEAFAAAAAVGGLGGLAQIGNTGNMLDTSNNVRNGVTAQTSQESEQILNHFLNRLPTITLKEGSRARVYIGTDLLIPSYADHRVDPTL